MADSERAPPVPAKDLGERIDGAAVNRLSHEKKARLFAGLGEEFFVHPLEENTYRVVTLKDNGNHSMYTVSVFHRPICECHDFIFECIGSKRWCKHIFRVWAEVHAGELPPLGIDPADWLQLRLEDTLFALIDKPDDTDKEQARAVRAAYKALDADAPDAETFWTATSLWRQHRHTRPSA